MLGCPWPCLKRKSRASAAPYIAERVHLVFCRGTGMLCTVLVHVLWQRAAVTVRAARGLTACCPCPHHSVFWQ